MFLDCFPGDCFQLGLEKVKLFESVDRPNTTHKLVIMWSVTLELVWTTGFTSFLSRRCVWTWTKLWPRKSYFCRTESYIIECDSCPHSSYFLWFIDRVLNYSLVLRTWPPSVNICGRRRGLKSQNNGLATGVLFFLLPSSRVSSFAQMPCLAHKEPVMQANASHFRLDHMIRNALAARNN